MRVSRKVCVAFVCALLWNCNLPAATREFMELTKAVMIADPGVWNEQFQLYVKGDVGLGTDALNAIAQELKRHPNWTVLLVANCDNEQYTDKDGRRQTRAKAVEFAIGHGLFSLPKFQERREENQPSRTAMVITFDPPATGQRYVGWFSSPAMEAYGLSNEQHWTGNLDQIAIRRLKQGRQVAGAIQDVTTEIDNRFAGLVAGRKAQAAARQAEAERSQRNTEAQVANAGQALSFLESRLGLFTKTYPKVTGDLAHPELPKLHAKLENAKTALKGSNLDVAASEASAVTAACQSHVQALDLYPSAKDQIKALQTDLAKIQQDPEAAAAAKEIKFAKEQIAAAQSEWERGDLHYLSSLKVTQEAVSRARTAEESAAHAAAVRSFIRSLFEATLVAAVILALAWLHLLRRFAKGRADKLLADWQAAMSEKSDALFKLDELRQDVLGKSRNDLKYSGTTAELADKVIDAVGKLWIMQASARTILVQALAVTAPKNPVLRLINLFRAAPYKEAVAMLGDRPITFSPESGLPLLFAGENRTEYEVLWADLKHFQAFEMSWNELKEQFAQTSKFAYKSLNEISDAHLNTLPALRTMQQELDTAVTGYRALEESLQGRQMALLPSFIGKLVPALTQSLQDAIKAAAVDPVRAMEGAGQLKKRVDAAQAVLQSVNKFAKEEVPGIFQLADELKTAGIEPAWIRDGLLEYFKLANGELGSLANGNAAAANHFGRCAQEFSARCAKAKALAERWKALSKALSDAEMQVAGTRDELSRAFKVAPDAILKEKDHEPDPLLAEAGQLSGLAKSGLAAGNLDRAEAHLNEAAERCGAAAALVTRTVEVSKACPAKRQAILSAGEAVQARIPRCREVLDRLTGNFDPEVLLLSAGDPTHPRANGTIADNIEEASEALRQRGDLLVEADKLFTAGQVLAAAAKLEQADGAVQFADHRLSEICEKDKRLAEANAFNDAMLKKCQTALSTLQAGLDQTTTGELTRNSASLAKVLAAKIATALKRPNPNPFALQAELNSLADRVTETQQGIERDHAQWVEAGEALKSAERAIQDLAERNARAEKDDIPDGDGLEFASKGLRNLQRDFPELQRVFTRSQHDHWSNFAEKAKDMRNAAFQAIAALERDLEAGKKCLAEINKAEQKMRDYRGWRSSYGVNTNGSPGRSQFEEARRALEAGRYADAERQAALAYAAALQAINQANALEAEAKRQAEIAEEQERARRESEEASRRAAYSSPSDNSPSTFPSWGGSDSGGSMSPIGISDSGGSMSNW